MEKKQEKALRIVSFTRDEFDRVTCSAMEKTLADAMEKIGPSGALIIPLINAIFVRELRDRLFPEEANEDAANSAR